jgi:phage baseplate assembly protein W
MSIVNVQKITRKNDYSDLDLDFGANPITGDISKKIGEDSIARSIRNLIFLNFYEKPFQPSVGSNAIKLLFENINVMTANLLRDSIIQVIQNYEPRASLIEVNVTSKPDENAYQAKIIFRPINKKEPYTMSVLLERIR